MTPGRSRWLLRSALLLVLAVAVLLWWLTREQGQNNVLMVENRSGETVTELRVTVGNDTNRLHDLANNANANAVLRTGTDEPFSVKGELRDGTMIRGQGRLPEGAILVILPGGQIQIRQPGKS